MKKAGRNDLCPCNSGKKYKHCCLAQDLAQAARIRAEDASAQIAIRSALEHHQAGRLPEAEAACRQILQIRPGHADALHCLGLIACQAGKYEAAVELLTRAVSVKPRNVDAHFWMALALKELGNLDGAIASYRKTLALRPDMVEASCNLGSVLREQGKFDAAVAVYRGALARRSDDALVHFNLGNALKEQGKLDQAVASYRKAISLAPDYADAHTNLAVVLQRQDKLEDAVAGFRKALLSRPDSAFGQRNLAFALLQQGDWAEAIAYYRKAIALEPDFAEAHVNLGFALQHLGMLDEAVVCFRNAIAVDADRADAYAHLGFTLQQQGYPQESVACYRKALSLKPDYAEAYTDLLFFGSYGALFNPEEYLALARGWERALVPAQEQQEARERIFRRPPLAGRRLKVGYLSGDFREHAVSYFVEPLFKHHDRSRIELFAYFNSSHRDGITARIESLADHWMTVAGLPDSAVRERVEADDIDVLIDLSGHTAYNRMAVFARRAAPVQAHYLGFFASTGLTEMDYWIGDDILTPAELDSQFSEKLWRLPRTWMSYQGRAEAPQPGWRPAADGSVWLGSFNHLNKLTPATLALWARVLLALPEGRLLLKTKLLADAGNRRRILGALSDLGIASDRVELQDGSITPGWAAHMAYYDRLDIALDPVGAHGGATTSCDALWMGVPLVTLAGERAASRVSSSILHGLGHPQWIASCGDDYVATAVALARDVGLRTRMRATQRNRMALSPLCDARDLAVHLENAYYEMFERWIGGKNGQNRAAQ